RDQPRRRRPRGRLAHRRLRLDQARRRGRRARQVRVVGRVRPPRDAGLAVPRVPAPVRDPAEQRLTVARSTREPAPAADLPPRVPVFLAGLVVAAAAMLGVQVLYMVVSGAPPAWLAFAALLVLISVPTAGAAVAWLGTRVTRDASDRRAALVFAGLGLVAGALWGSLLAGGLARQRADAGATGGGGPVAGQAAAGGATAPAWPGPVSSAARCGARCSPAGSRGSSPTRARAAGERSSRARPPSSASPPRSGRASAGSPRARRRTGRSSSSCSASRWSSSRSWASSADAATLATPPRRPHHTREDPPRAARARA